MQPSEGYPPPSEPSSATPEGGKTDLETSAQSPESIKIKPPNDIVRSLLRQDEWEKLQKYVAAYRGQHWRS